MCPVDAMSGTPGASKTRLIDEIYCVAATSWWQTIKANPSKEKMCKSYEVKLRFRNEEGYIKDTVTWHGAGAGRNCYFFDEFWTWCSRSSPKALAGTATSWKRKATLCGSRSRLKHCLLSTAGSGWKCRVIMRNSGCAAHGESWL